jgi:Arc/MetJ family transcription regulator
MSDVEFERKFRVRQAEALIARIGLTDNIEPVLASLSSELTAIASLAIPPDEREAIVHLLLTALCREAGDRAEQLALEAEIQRKAA